MSNCPSGLRALAHFGPVMHEVQVDLATSEAWEQAERELIEAFRVRVQQLGGKSDRGEVILGNAVVGLDLAADPWLDGDGRPVLLLSASGVACHLSAVEEGE
jgi:hypothetical protein